MAPLCVSIFAAVLLLSLHQKVSGQPEQCTAGFIKDITDVAGNLTVLPSADLAESDFVQWIFPFMKFTCQGKVTRWTLRVEQLGDLDLEEDDLWYIPQLSTWRSSRDDQDTSQQAGTYELQSFTNETIFTVNDKGIVFEYNPPIPMIIEPGDMVGIRMPPDVMARKTRMTKPLFLKLESGNSSIQSYNSLHNRTVIRISSVNEGLVRTTQTFIPLISLNIVPPDTTKTIEPFADDTSGANDATAGDNVSFEFVTGIAVGVSVVSLLTLITATFVIVVAVTYSRHKTKNDTERQYGNNSPLYDTIEADHDTNADATTPRNINIRPTEWLTQDNRLIHSNQLPEERPETTESHRHFQGYNRKMQTAVETSENLAYNLADQHTSQVPVQESEGHEYANLNTTHIW